MEVADPGSFSSGFIQSLNHWLEEDDVKVSCSYKGEVLVLLQAIGVFVLLKQFRQTVQVSFVKFLDVLAAGTGSLDDRDGLPH